MLYLSDSDIKKLGIRNKSHRETLITSLINFKPTLIPVYYPLYNKYVRCYILGDVIPE